MPRPRIGAVGGAFISLSMTELIGFGLEHRVQRLLDTRAHNLVHVSLQLPLIDLDRPARPPLSKVRKKRYVIPNQSPIGAALFWLPAYLIAVLARLDPTGLGDTARASTVLVSSGMVSLAVVLAHDLAKKAGGDATLGVSTVGLGSFFSYLWLFPGQYSHGVAIGISTLYVWYWFTRLDHQDAKSWLLLGLRGGLVALVRWQNVLLPLLSLPWKVSRAASRRHALT